jgi:outer membrane lipoprotein-sorting protein
MRFLRTVSTRRLLALIAGSVVAVAGGTAIAVAASSGGPVPRPKPLATAIHDALGAPAVKGISAQIQFTNHLIDSSNIVGVDPILTGASGRLWLSSDHRLRLELQGDRGDAQVVVSGATFWVYDPSANTVYRGTLPQGTGSKAPGKSTTPDTVPSIAQIQADIQHVLDSANLSGAVPSDVGGQPAYTVRISPKHDGGLLGAAELGWDSVHGVPLRLAIYAAGDGSPVIELKATGVSYGTIPSSVFSISPPNDAKVVQVSSPSGGTASKATAKNRGAKAATRAVGRGVKHASETVQSVQSKLKFTLVAPSTLVGLPRHTVRLVEFGHSAGALVTYGQNLGGILVLEQPAQSAGGGLGGALGGSSGSSGGERRRGLSLPTVSIGGVTGQELDTALGTMVRFTRGGVSYTVLGSVPAAAADAAARAL